MAKKKDNSQKVVNPAITADALAENQSNLPSKEVERNSKNAPKQGKNANKKEGRFARFFKKIGRAFKEMWFELKKVTWASFSKALISTGIVLAIVLIFLLILTGMDALFGFGFESLIGLGGK